MSSNKANEESLNSLHLMTAEAIAKLFSEAKGDPELLLKVIREARGFLKDNSVAADIEVSRPLQQIGAEINIAELPFEVQDED